MYDGTHHDALDLEKYKPYLSKTYEVFIILNLAMRS